MVENSYDFDRKSRKTSGTVITAFAGLVCVLAISLGVVALKTNKEKPNKQTKDVVDLNNVRREKESETKNDYQEKRENSRTDEENRDSEEITSVSDNEDTTQTEKNTEMESNSENIEQQTIKEPETKSVDALVADYKFAENGTINWPVKGEILLDYSMDKTIYFPTLDSYKCNPAIVIQSQDGMQVNAGVKGVVEEVSTGDEVGNYIVLGLGDGYEITYGQLQDIQVQVGDEVKNDTVIGTVAAPTRYYSNEGTNLYMEVTKDGNPVDPLEFMK